MISQIKHGLYFKKMKNIYNLINNYTLLMQCQSGCGFFATSGGYCSRCTPKQYVQENTCPPPPLSLDTPVTVQINKSLQVNKSRCWKCSKKIGILGIECACSYLFCTACRHAEMHQCTFDYAKHGKEQLTKNNPLVTGTKLERL